MLAERNLKLLLSFGDPVIISIIFFFFFQLGEKYYIYIDTRTQPAITCSKLTIETLEQSVKYVQSEQ